MGWHRILLVLWVHVFLTIYEYMYFFQYVSTCISYNIIMLYRVHLVMSGNRHRLHR
jgi:Ca2+/H+ antiporter